MLALKRGSYEKITGCFSLHRVPTVVFAAEGGYKVAYDGGSVSDTKTGTDLKLVHYLRPHPTHEKQGRGHNDPVSAITEISYGQDVHRA